MKKWLIKVQSAVLLAGTVFSGAVIYFDFARFYELEGTIFKIQDCLIPNPVTTPCFYGFFAFLIAFIWSVRIWQKKVKNTKQQQKYLNWFLVAGNIFAWGNFLWSVIPYWQGSSAGVSCSGVAFSNPFETACFIGSVIFLLALLNGLWVYRQYNNATRRTG